MIKWTAIFGAVIAVAVIVPMMMVAMAQGNCGDDADATYAGPGSLGGVMGTGFTRAEVKKARQHPYGGTTVVPSRNYVATAYAPSAGGINCDVGGACNAFASGLYNDGGKRRLYAVASNPQMNKYGAFAWIWPNPYGFRGPFLVVDTGGNFNGTDGRYRVDFYIWGDKDEKKSNAWGRRTVALTSGPSTTTAQGPASSGGERTDLETVAKSVKRLSGSPVGWAVVDEQGNVVASTGGAATNPGRSVSKVMILIALTKKAAKRELTSREQQLASAMIQNSDNAASNALLAEVGLARVNAVAQEAGLKNWRPNTNDRVYRLGLSRISAADIARIFAQLDRLLAPRHEEKAMQLLESIQGAGRFGVLKAGIGNVASKGGWSPEGRGWTVNQGAQLQVRGHKYGFGMVLGEQRNFDAGATQITEVAKKTNAALGGSEDNSEVCAATAGEAPNGTGADAVKTAADWLEKKRYPYCYGGGHVTPARPTTGQYCWTAGGVQDFGSKDKGYDCSSSTSFILQHAGINVDTMVSGSYMTWGKPGPGRRVTIYANADHVFLEIDGHRFSTSQSNYRHGPGWVPTESRPTAGFVARHPEGM